MRTRLLVSVAALAGFVVLAFGSSPDSGDFSMTPTVPESLVKDQPAQIVLTVDNNGDDEITLDRVGIETWLLRSWELTGATPPLVPDGMTEDEDHGKVSFELTPTPVAPGGRVEVVLDILPRLAGTKEGTIEVRATDDTRSFRTVTTDVEGPEEDPLVIEVDLQDGESQGTHLLTVDLKNQGVWPDRLRSLTVPATLLDLARVTGAEPALTPTEDSITGGLTYDYQHELAPGASRSYVFTLEAVRDGTVEGYVNICMQSLTLCQQPTVVLDVR